MPTKVFIFVFIYVCVVLCVCILICFGGFCLFFVGFLCGGDGCGCVYVMFW